MTGSRLAYGCWRLAGTTNPAEVQPQNRENGRRALIAAFEAGYTFFDTADIYCRGEVDKIIGQTLRDVPAMRERIMIVTKCGVRHVGDPSPDSPHRWDFSASHIHFQSCEQSLERLGIDTVDVLLLHRPDYLADPMEVAQAFTAVEGRGQSPAFWRQQFSSDAADRDSGGVSDAIWSCIRWKSAWRS